MRERLGGKRVETDRQTDQGGRERKREIKSEMRERIGGKRVEATERQTEQYILFSQSLSNKIQF